MLTPRLALERPLAFFDLETTGKYPDRDRIVDITIVRVGTDGGCTRFSSFVHPGMPIPPSATEVHGITDAMVAQAPTFAELSPLVWARFEGADLAGYNIRRFDVPMLCAEFKRAKHPFSMDGRRIVDAQAIFFKREPRDLSAAVAFYTGQTLEGMHRAEVDVLATMQVLAGQLERYADLPGTVEALHDYCRDPKWIDESGRLIWDQGVACIGFGKNAGRPLASLAAEPTGRDYLHWILKSDFPDDMKQIVRRALDGKFPTPPDTTPAPTAPPAEAAHAGLF